MSLWENNLVVPSYSTTRTGDAVLWAEQTALPGGQTHWGTRDSEHHKNLGLYEKINWLLSVHLATRIWPFIALSPLCFMADFFPAPQKHPILEWPSEDRLTKTLLSWNAYGNAQSKGLIFVLRLEFMQCFPFWKVWGVETVPYDTSWVFRTFQQ